MYLHIGQNVVIPESSVIGIFDMDNTTASRITRRFLSGAEKGGRVTSVSDELPNSFIVCDEEKTTRQAPVYRILDRGNENERNEMKIYLSQLSSLTLIKRSGTMRLE